MIPMVITRKPAYILAFLALPSSCVEAIAWIIFLSCKDEIDICYSPNKELAFFSVNGRVAGETSP